MLNESGGVLTVRESPLLVRSVYHGQSLLCRVCGVSPRYLTAEEASTVCSKLAVRKSVITVVPHTTSVPLYKGDGSIGVEV